MHDGIILLLLLPESFMVLLSCANKGFCYLNLTGMICKKKNEMSSDLSVYTIVKGRHRANGLFFEIKCDI